ncbi:hypothetical protein [Isoalcanivorax indicus]|uniref:hypothetical protein n=1 Tax=Isoalcanivorax indicus TaxID=2202653 RepID=UPI000DB94E10|nr:hypothetical protein [Isoalcanivorax indicus]
MQNVVAIPANPALVNSTEDFLHAMDHGKPAAELFITMVDRLTDRMLGLFLLEPAQMTELSGGQRKIIDFAVSTASKASSMLTRQIYKKVTNAEFAPIAKNVRAMYWSAGDDNGQHAAIAFPVSASFAEEFRRAADAAESGRGTAEVPLISKVMDQLTDEILDNVFLAQTREVKIGFVTQKALNVGVEGSRKAIHAVNHKVLRGLSDDELKGFMGHYSQIVTTR